MRTLVALCALLAACWAAPLSPALRPREIAGPRNLNRPFVFFESQRLPRGGAGKTTSVFTTTSNFGGQRRLSTDDLSAAVPADSLEARSEDAVASLIKSFGGSLQEKRRLDDSSEESSEEEDEGPSPASAPSPAQKSTVVIQDQVASTGSSVASGGASTSISDFSPVLLNAAIKQVHIPIVRPSLGGGEVKVITDGSSAVGDGATRGAGDAVVATSGSQSAQQGKNSNGDSSVQSTATSAPEGENKHAADCKTSHEKITTGTADPKTPTNANNLPIVFSGEPAISGEGASAQGIPGSAISLTQITAQAESVPVKVSENVNQEQSGSVTSSTAAGNVLQVPANSAGRTPADAGGNDGTSSPAHAELPRVNIGTSASSSSLEQAPHSTGLSENQDDELKVGSFNAQASLAQTSGITVTVDAAAKDVSSDFKASEISASNSGDVSVPGVQTSSITLTFLNGKHAEPSGSDKPQAADGGAEYTQLVNGPVHTPSKPTVLKLQSPYATRFFPNQLPQHTISPTPPPTSITPEVAQLATSGQPQGSAFTNSQGSQPHTRIFFSPPSQNPKGQQQPLAAPPYFVSFRHDYVNPNKPTFPQGQVSYTTKQKVPAEVLLPHILSQEAAANENAPGGDKGLQNRVRPQQPSPPSNSGPQANQQVFAPPSYNPGFSPHFSLAPGYKGPVTTIILNPDLSSPYQFGSYVPRSESSDQKREGLYKVKSFVPSVSATVPGSPAYTATSFVPDRQTYSQGGKVFKVTSFVPRGSRPVQGGFRQTVQPIPNGQRSFPSAPGRTVYRVAPVGSRRSQPAQRLQDLHVTVIGPGGQLRAPQQRVFNIAPFAPQARAVSARQGLQPAGSAQSRFPPFRRRPQQAIVEVRAVPIQFHQRPAGHRVTPSFHEQPLTFYDVPQRQSAGGPALRPSVASANGPGFPNGRARFQPVQVVRKAVGPPSPPQPLIASAAYQAPVFHGVTRVVIRPGQSIVSR
ncbi:hypothetical protein ISCGN_026124 [Ixodes scapularis]